MQFDFVTVAALIAIPLTLWVLWTNSQKTHYEGEALALVDTLYISHLSATAYVSFVVPDTQDDEPMLIASISLPRAYHLRHQDSAHYPANILVTKRLFGGLRIEEIEWEDGHRDEDRRTDGLGLIAFYMVMAFILCVAKMPAAGGICYILSGFLTGSVLMKTRVDRTHQGQMISLFIAAAICLLGSVCFFNGPGVLNFFPGPIVAFSFGQVVGMLGRAADPVKQGK